MNELIIYLISITTFSMGMNDKCINENLQGYAESNYETNINTVYICDTLGLESSLIYEDTIYHELGHIYYFRLLSDNQIKSRERLYDYSLKNNLFISDYAKTSAKEDFAETFRDLYYNKNTKFSKSLLLKKLILNTKIP